MRLEERRGGGKEERKGETRRGKYIRGKKASCIGIVKYYSYKGVASVSGLYKGENVKDHIYPF